jgi:hypothetical protein
VNRLVKALIERPQVIDPQVIEKTTHRKRVTFSQLLDALGDTLFSQRELGYLQSNPDVRQRLEQSYLPTITALEWDRALSLTVDRTADNSGWWTAMVAGASGRFGLTVPQNGSRSELIALYAGQEDNAKLLIYSLARGTVREVTDGPHCGPASLGECLKGICGTCKSYRVYRKGTHGPGVKCMCDHQVGQR